MKLTTHNKCRLSLAAAVSLVSVQVFSQNAQLSLEEVVVTAQKRAESLQDVPISIVAFNSEALAIKGIDSLNEISTSVPNLFVAPFNTTPVAVLPKIRGIGPAGLQITQDPSVALYLDGVYLGTTFGAGFDGVDMERLEVLRGPQGTLYGRNATGGAINIITRRASTEALEFSQQFTGGNLGRFKSKTSINVPLTERSAFKVAYVKSDRDGVVENKGPGEDFGTEDRESVVADLRFLVTEDFTVDYRYERAELKDSMRFSQITSEGTGGALGNFVTLTQVSSDRLDSATALFPVPGNDFDIEAHTLTMEWALNSDIALKSITARRDLDELAFSYALPTASVNFGLGPQTTGMNESEMDFEQVSQEFQLLGSSDALEYVVGLIYYQDDSFFDESETIQITGARGIPNFTDSENSSAAVFSQATYTPEWGGQRWHVTVGARYAEDSRESFRVNRLSAGFAASAPNGADYDKDFSNLTGTFTLAYDLSDDVNMYGTVASAYKSGGTSVRSANAQLFAEGFEEEDVLSYELGLKGDFLERRLRVNSAVFYTELEGMQASVQTGATPGERDFLPIDGNTIAGIEIDLSAVLTDSLILDVAYAHLDTKLGEDQVTSAAGTFQLIDELAQSAQNSYSVSLNYRRPLANGSLFGAVSYNYRGSMETSINVADNTTIDSYGLANASLGWSDIKVSDLPGAFKIMLWGKNLSDEEYGLISNASFRFANASRIDQFGDPRTYGVSLYYDY